MNTTTKRSGQPDMDKAVQAKLCTQERGEVKSVSTHGKVIGGGQRWLRVRDQEPLDVMQRCAISCATRRRMGAEVQYRTKILPRLQEGLHNAFKTYVAVMQAGCFSGVLNMSKLLQWHARCACHERCTHADVKGALPQKCVHSPPDAAPHGSG